MPDLPRFGPPGGEQRQRPGPEDYSEAEIGRPDETSEVELTRVPPREELQRLPKTVLLKIAIELDPDAVASSYEEGWTKDDILRVIERHIKAALGRQPIEGWPYIGEVEVIESTAVEEDEEEKERDWGE